MRWRGFGLRPEKQQERWSLGVLMSRLASLCRPRFDAIMPAVRRDPPRMAERRELLTWDEVARLIDHLIPQFQTEFEAMVIVTRGGGVPGGLLCGAPGIKDVRTAAVDFPFELEREEARLLAWPRFIQFPDDRQLRGRRVLVVDDVWGSGRRIPAGKERVAGAGGIPSTCVLHFNPYRRLFTPAQPHSSAAIPAPHTIYPWE